MKIKTIILIVVVVVIIGFLATKGLVSMTGWISSATCGNNVCETGENLGICPDDCPTMCGNDICEEGENITCKIDCNNATKEVQELQDKGLLASLFSWFKY